VITQEAKSKTSKQSRPSQEDIDFYNTIKEPNQSVIKEQLAQDPQFSMHNLVLLNVMRWIYSANLLTFVNESIH